MKNIRAAICLLVVLQTTESFAAPPKKKKPAPAKKSKKGAKKPAPVIKKPVIAPMPIPTPASHIIDLEKEAMAKELGQLRKELAEQKAIAARMPHDAERQAHERTIAELRTELGHAQTAVARLDELAKQQAEELQRFREKESIKERSEKQAAPEEPRVVPAEPETRGVPPPPPPPPGFGKRENKQEKKKELQPQPAAGPKTEPAGRESLMEAVKGHKGVAGLKKVEKTASDWQKRLDELEHKQRIAPSKFSVPEKLEITLLREQIAIANNIDSLAKKRELSPIEQKQLAKYRDDLGIRQKDLNDLEKANKTKKEEVAKRISLRRAQEEELEGPGWE